MTHGPYCWRKSSYSASQSACVEVAQRVDGDVFVRNSNHRDAGTLCVSLAAFAAWVTGCKGGEIDDFAG